MLDESPPQIAMSTSQQSSMQILRISQKPVTPASETPIKAYLKSLTIGISNVLNSKDFDSPYLDYLGPEISKICLPFHILEVGRR